MSLWHIETNLARQYPLVRGAISVRCVRDKFCIYFAQHFIEVTYQNDFKYVEWPGQNHYVSAQFTLRGSAMGDALDKFAQFISAIYLTSAPTVDMLIKMKNSPISANIYDNSYDALEGFLRKYYEYRAPIARILPQPIAEEILEHLAQ